MAEEIDIEFDFAKKFNYKGLSDKKDVSDFFTQNIDYKKLLDTLALDGFFEYKAREYINNKYVTTYISGSGASSSQSPIEIPYMILEEEDKERKLIISGQLNPKEGKINRNRNYKFKISFKYKDEQIRYVLEIPFAEYSSNKDSDRLAIILSTTHYADFEFVVKLLHHKITDEIENKIYSIFNEGFSNARKGKNPKDKLDFLYHDAPPFVLARRNIEYPSILLRDLATIAGGNINEIGTNEEKAVLNILSSFSFVKPDDKDANKTLIGNSNTLLSGLLTTKIEQKTLFEILYRKMNDYWGDDNFTRFLQLIYAFWLQSFYSNSDYDIYSKFNGPTYIPYVSKKSTFFNSDNFTFKFIDEKIIATETKTVQRPSKNNNSKSSPYYLRTYGGEKPLYDVITNNYFYHIYQPIDFVDLKPDGEFPLPQGTIPAFFLKAFDDKNQWSNIENRIMLGVDVVTFFVAIGALSKLRYLLYLSNTQKAIRYAMIGIEISSSVVSMITTITKDCNGSEFCKRLSDYLFFLELSSMGIDTLVERYMRQAARRALNQMSEDLKKKYPKLYKHLNEVSDSGKNSLRQTEREAFRKADAEMKVIESDLDKTRNDYSVTKIEDGYTLNRDKIVPAYYDKRNKKIVHENLKVESARLLYELRKRAPNKNVMRANVSIKYKGVEYWSFDFLENAGSKNYVASNTVGNNVEKIDKNKMYDALTDQNRHNDTENKMLSFSDEKIAEVLGDINDKQGTKITYKDLEISYRIESSFEPCIVCKREILIRSEMYNAKFVIYSPDFIEGNKRYPVRDSKQFEIYYKQLIKQTR